MDTASLFCYCEQPEIRILLVGRDTSLQLVESFIDWLVGAFERILSTGPSGR